MARVLLNCFDVVGPAMAGPGIRYWELARALSKNHDVTLRSPFPPGAQSDAFQVVRAAGDDQVAGQDIVVSQVISPALARAAAKAGARTIFDAYDPVSLELLEWHSREPLPTRRRINAHTRAWEGFSLRAATSVICASERQRDLWLGALAALGRVTPEVYDRDRSLRSLIDVVSFGLPMEPPQQTGSGFRERLGIKPDDFVGLWGGGLWEWLDPLTPIRAIAKLGERRDDIKLVFMGVRHPNPDLPEMTMVTQARELARELHVLDRLVFLNDAWVPYQERANYLLEANAGISMHRDNLEARFAFRTRMLDYIWAGLPIVCTTGDTVADLVRTDGLGRVIGYEDVDAAADAFEFMADQLHELAQMRERVAAVRPRFQWHAIVQPLERHIGAVQQDTILSQRRLRRMTLDYYGRLGGEYIASEGLAAASRRAVSEVRRRFDRSSSKSSN